MLFDIGDLDARGVALDHVVQIPSFTWEGGETVACEPATFRGRIRKTRRGVELVATFETVVHLHCSRCLAPFDLAVGRTFRLFLLPDLGEATATAWEGGKDDPDALDLYPLEGETVDFGVVLQEQVDLALPYRPLCRPDCRGLCPGCGADLNREPCRCEAPVDERFRALADLKLVLERRSRGSSGRK